MQTDGAGVRLIAELRDRLAACGDPQRAAAQQAYMKSTLPFYGVASRELAATVRAVADAHPLPDRAAWEATVRALVDEATHREEWYAALHLAGHRRYRPYQSPASLPLYRHMVTATAWWDVVDSVAAHRVGQVLRDFPGEATRIRAWSVDDHLWVRRTAMLAQLTFKGDTDRGLLSDVLAANLEDSPHGRTFWIRKALGWSLRQFARTDPQWVLAWVAQYDAGLSGLSRREAVRHLKSIG